MEKSKVSPLAAAGLGVAAGALSGLYFRRFKSLATIGQADFLQRLQPVSYGRQAQIQYR